MVPFLLTKHIDFLINIRIFEGYLMPIRTSGGVFDQQILTGSLSHWVVCGADFSGAINSYGQAVPYSAAEIIFKNIEASATINIMNPNGANLSFALEEGRSTWDEISLTEMIQGLGTDVGVDHLDLTACTARQVPYVWGCGAGGPLSFLELTDTPASYFGKAGMAVFVNSTETGLVFDTILNPALPPNAFSVIDVPTQPSVLSVGLDTLTIIPGTNVVITTNPAFRQITINATGDNDYTPVPPGTTLNFSTKYYVTSSGTVTLPLGTGSGRAAGSSIYVSKAIGSIIFVNVFNPSDIIATDLGNTNSIEFDATQECIFIFDGISTWNLQIGSVN